MNKDEMNVLPFVWCKTSINVAKRIALFILIIRFSWICGNKEINKYMKEL